MRGNEGQLPFFRPSLRPTRPPKEGVKDEGGRMNGREQIDFSERQIVQASPNLLSDWSS